MQLVGYDHEGTIIAGPGRIEIDDARLSFHMYGDAADGELAIRKFTAAMDNPYEAREQFRLVATDYNGKEWNGGFTSVSFFADGNRGWPMTGTLNGLTTIVSEPWVSATSGVELIISPPVPLPMSEVLVSTSSIGTDAIQVIRSPGRQVVEALGSQIVFSNEPSGEALWITAETSPNLKHPFAENWLCEPLRIMLGAPIYPRVTARNFGDGRAHVTLLPAPKKWRRSTFGLMQPWGGQPAHTEHFWQLYADTLTMIGNARDPQGRENFDEHQVTRLYSELVQADKGSRWVKLLTLASTIEALAKSLMTGADRQPEFPVTALNSMATHISGWADNKQLRDRMLGFLGLVRERSVIAFLRGLASRNVIPNHCQTWYDLRNSVMHGDLVDPWPTVQGDAHLRELISLVHGLTCAVIAKG